MFARLFGLAAALAILGPTSAFAQMATAAPGMMMASPMPGHHMKHHRHHRHHKHCRDASGKFVKCTAMGAMPMDSDKQ